MSRANVPSKNGKRDLEPRLYKGRYRHSSLLPHSRLLPGFASVCEYPGSGATPQSSFVSPRSVTAVPMKQPGTELALTLVAS
jgi:hypothetical protein